MVTPLAFVAPYRGIAETARKVCKDFQWDIRVVEGDLYSGLELGRELAGEGAEVFISRGGTAKLLKANLGIPVVEVKVTAFDILEALQKVGPKARRIGIVGFENVIRGAEKLGRPLNMDLVVLTIQDEGEVSERLREGRETGVDAIIGDKIVVSLAETLGMKAVLIESGYESVLHSFSEARDILDAVRAEAEKSKRHLETLNQLKAVLDAVDEHMVILDSGDLVQSCNPAALQTLGKPLKELCGKPLSYYPSGPLAATRRNGMPVRNHLAVVQKHHLLLDYMPIENAGERIGTLIVGRGVSRIQQAERKVRAELYDMGHVARYGFDDLITGDDRFQDTLKRARSFASSNSTVLIIGETGTGKELFAQSIHNEKGGEKRPFVAINCATLPEPLLESELFGYAPGAFTGARNKRKKGFFELSHGGTLFLDEIGELPLNLQSRLLRVIEERVVQPLGDDRVIPVSIHIIAATNRDLGMEVRERKFRADLFYRLNVLQLQIPPLRERGRDAFILFQHFVRQFNSAFDGEKVLSPEVGNIICGYSWPGNVRELRNLVERLATLTRSFSDIGLDVPTWIREELRQSERAAPLEAEEEPPGVNLKQMEKAWIKKLCRNSSLSQDEIAKLLGVSRTTLWKLRKEL